MITHYAGLQLNTVSIPSARQYYHERLLLPIVEESESRIEFRITEHCTIVFQEAYEPVAPAHLAFEVPYSEFDALVAFLKSRQVMIEKWPDGREVDHFGTGQNIYFRDGDGNLLELIAHPYIKEDVVAPSGALRVLYMREVGFPVEHVKAFRERLQDMFDFKLDKVYDNFTFAIGGTAHFVLTAKQRRWIPISMLALPPRMLVTLGVSDESYIQVVRSRLREEEMVSANDRELHMIINDYHLCLRAATGFGKNLPALLHLPLSIKD
ncbi:VOC family protein [Paenibacillus sepulcri]|uniref:Glyoxalase/bleomycin resistance/dioxygenase family protein n=1 Tax=Paenibacillus sepulcri TaxID=359917 RepID=A0ABS7C4M5_9BACL|nr:glyoxalase/bleomycin resistance/dioxygenase family protein [Paenibacillus sepulcri]